MVTALSCRTCPRAGRRRWGKTGHRTYDWSSRSRASRSPKAPPAAAAGSCPVLEQGHEAVDLAPTRLRPQHQVVHERPGLRVEERGPVLLGVLGRAGLHGEKRGQRQESALPHRPDVLGHGPPLVDPVALDHRVSPELRQPLVEPGRQRAEVRAQGDVDVLVEDHEIRVVTGDVAFPKPGRVHAHRHPVPLGRVHEQARGAKGTSRFPEGREQGAELLLVPHGQDASRAEPPRGAFPARHPAGAREPLRTATARGARPPRSRRTGR